MKLSVPKPENLLLPGDPPEKEPDPPVIVHTHKPRGDPSLIQARVQRLLKRGLIHRAVVAPLPTEKESLEGSMDPWNWGIVVGLNPADAACVRIRWLDGKNTYTDGSDIMVIHPGMNRIDMEAFLRGK